ncbi:MAG: hypothetical protein WBH09_08620 [Rugosibacter sp.]
MMAIIFGKLRIAMAKHFPPPAVFNRLTPITMQTPPRRIYISENEWTSDAKGIAGEKLATFLFFRTIEQ